VTAYHDRALNVVRHLVVEVTSAGRPGTFADYKAPDISRPGGVPYAAQVKGMRGATAGPLVVCHRRPVVCRVCPLTSSRAYHQRAPHAAPAQHEHAEVEILRAPVLAGAVGPQPNDRLQVSVALTTAASVWTRCARIERVREASHQAASTRRPRWRYSRYRSWTGGDADRRR
jgi:hypothetical protein